LPFQENPKTGDCRISGSCASLAGLEKALKEETNVEVELAIRRIVLIHSVILTVGGIPLIYLGDEVGTLNDYKYREDASKASDSRWVHRPAADWEKMACRNDETTLEGRIYKWLHQLIEIRKTQTGFAGTDMQVMNTGNDQVLGYVRQREGKRMLVLANFGEDEQKVAANFVRVHGLDYVFKDLVSGETINLTSDMVLEPYRVMWLAAE
jgi:glycosidase